MGRRRGGLGRLSLIFYIPKIIGMKGGRQICDGGAKTVNVGAKTGIEGAKTVNGGAKRGIGAPKQLMGEPKQALRAPKQLTEALKEALGTQKHLTGRKNRHRVAKILNGWLF